MVWRRSQRDRQSNNRAVRPVSGLFRAFEEGGGAILDLALDRAGDDVQQARQFEIDPDKILVDLDAAGDCLHQRDDAEIERVIVPAVVERLHIGRDLGADLGEAIVDAALGAVAAELVRDRDGDRFSRGLHMVGTLGETPGLPMAPPTGLMCSIGARNAKDLTRWRNSRYAAKSPARSGRSKLRPGTRSPRTTRWSYLGGG